MRIGACLAISGALAGLAGWLDSAGRFGRIEGSVSDLAYPRGSLDDHVAVVAVDTKALAEIDPSWPWPRQRFADLVRDLNGHGAAAVVFDVAFVSSAPGDDDFAAAIHDAGNVILAATALSPDAEPPRDPSTGLQEPTVVEPVEPLRSAALAVGHTLVRLDHTDGVVREVPLVVEDSDRRVVPALSLASLSAESHASFDPIVRRPTGVQVGERAIPTDESYELRVSYTPELQSFETRDPVYSAADVLDGGVSDDAIRGKVVFVGVTDVSLGDRLPTPVAKSSGLPGVMVQANAFNTMVDRSYVRIASPLETALAVLVVSLVLTFAVQFLPAWLAGLVSVGTLLGYWLAAYTRSDAGTLMNITYPTIAVALAVPLSGAVRYFVETRQRRRVAVLFSQYVPPSVAATLIDEGRVGPATEGQRVDVTAMFCDLRGFTARSAKLKPIEVNAMLSDFYEYGSQLVLAHGGTVMSYIGDEILAIFGAPAPSDDHARRAVECARELQENVASLDGMLVPHGFEPLRFGIGLNAGEVVAAHAGSSWRRQYTVIGDAVNVASRLCGRAGPGQVVLSDSVRSPLEPPPAVERLDGPPMKGVSAAFVAWRLVLEHPPSGTADR